MGLFDFFKRSSKPKFDYTTETDIRKIINNGVLFSDSKSFLNWGVPADILKNSIGAKKKIFADRTVYNWGEHEILNGVKLDLFTVYWDHKESSQDKLFNSIEFRATGNEDAERYMEVIKSHIEISFGVPNDKHITETETIYEWVVLNVKIYLRFYEQYHINKLHFEISKL